MKSIDLRAWSCGVSAVAAAALTLIAAPAEAQAPRDQLRVAMYSKTQARANPFTSYAPSVFWFTPIYDSMTRINQEGALVPWIAESWRLVDPTTWRFTLRPNLEFSNGAKLDAAAVAETITYLITDEKGKTTNAANDARPIASATAIDPLTVEIKTKEPNPTVPRMAAIFFVFEPKAWKDLGVDSYAARPVTSGPFRVESWTDSEARMVAFDKSWRRPKVQRLTITELPEQVTRLQGLLSNQLDVIIGMSPDDIKQLRDAGHGVPTYPSTITMSVALHTTDFVGKYGDKGTPFKDRRVRQAMNHAVDREAIVKDILGGNGRLAAQPGNPASFGYDPGIRPYAYDPARARQLLTEAGYPNGFEFTLEVITGALPKDREIYTYVGDSLAKVGAKAELRLITLPDYLRKFLQGTWEGQGMGLAFRVEPTMDVARVFSSWTCRWPKKFFCLEDMMPAIDASDREMDVDKRRTMLQQISRRMNEEANALFLVNHVDIYGVNKRAKGFDQWNLAILYENISLE
jgi:peptide/nickel transport system substrate-binding protein